MNPSQDFNRLYADVSGSIAAAMAEVADLKVEHKDGKQEIGNIMERLRGIQARFDGELSVLEKHAEWDKFTMAFFGETNAGKSTIIESLRILFNEDARQQLLRQNAHDLESFERALSDHVEKVREGLKQVYVGYAAEIKGIQRSAATLSAVLQQEASARTYVLQQESAARTQLLQQEADARTRVQQQESEARTRVLQQESDARTQLLQQESSARMKRKLWLFTTAGASLGAVLSIAFAKAAGG